MTLGFIDRAHASLAAVAAACLVIFVCGCTKPQPRNAEPKGQMRTATSNAIPQERLAKDEEFKSGGNSPIPEPERREFHGLAYFPINPDLVFSVTLHRYPAPKQIKLATNTGEIRRSLRYGYFEFQVDGQSCQLQVYRLEDSSGSTASLFIPFRDATSGRETYAAGRYLDLEENTSGLYELNFNRAYNPYCAFNSEFSCPVPPAENTLRVPIRAGEKKYAHERKS
jgi:uncharacterized protein (DUF1684 family)